MYSDFRCEIESLVSQQVFLFSFEKKKEKKRILLLESWKIHSPRGIFQREQTVNCWQE